MPSVAWAARGERGRGLILGVAVLDVRGAYPQEDSEGKGFSVQEESTLARHVRDLLSRALADCPAGPVTVIVNGKETVQGNCSAAVELRELMMYQGSTWDTGLVALLKDTGLQ
jgi:hypothetical protein